LAWQPHGGKHAQEAAKHSLTGFRDGAQHLSEAASKTRVSAKSSDGVLPLGAVNVSRKPQVGPGSKIHRCSLDTNPHTFPFPAHWNIDWHVTCKRTV